MPLARLAKGSTREGGFTPSRALVRTLDTLVSPGRARQLQWINHIVISKQI